MGSNQITERGNFMAEVGDNSKAGLVSALNGAWADTVALYFKTKNFHWHVAGPRFRDLHVLFDEQAAQLIGMVDDLGERVRKNDEFTLTSIGSVQKQTRIEDQDDVTPRKAMKNPTEGTPRTAIRDGLIETHYKKAAERRRGKGSGNREEKNDKR